MRLSRKQFSPFFSGFFFSRKLTGSAFLSAVPPVLSVFQQSFNATADYQESVTFTCITSGSPDPVVTWHRYLFFPPIYLNPSPPPTALSSALAVWLGKILKSGKLLKQGEGFASKSQNIRQLMRDGISFHRVFVTQLRGFGPKSGSKSREELMAPALCGCSQMGFKMLKKIC